MDQKPENTSELGRHLTAQDLADRISVPLATIYGWRTKGCGPRGMRIGKYVRYRLADVEDWEESQADVRSA